MEHNQREYHAYSNSKMVMKARRIHKVYEKEEVKPNKKRIEFAFGQLESFYVECHLACPCLYYLN